LILVAIHRIASPDGPSKDLAFASTQNRARSFELLSWIRLRGLDIRQTRCLPDRRLRIPSRFTTMFNIRSPSDRKTPR
jgi:hypothetical protein